MRSQKAPKTGTRHFFEFLTLPSNSKNMDNYYSPNDVLTHVALTPEEEASLFEKFYAGDLAARDRLIENNLRYAASIALRHASRRDLQKEVISAANLGLIKALESRRFEPSQGRFTTFATKYILGEICSIFRISGSVSFPAGRLPDWPENESDPEVDTLADPRGFQPAQLDFEALHDALGALDEKERALLELIFFADESVASSARILGLSRQWATELRNRAFAKLRLALGVRQTPAGDVEETEEKEAA